MMTPEQWAIKWGVPFDALHDLRRLMNVETDPGTEHAGLSEAAVQNAVRREASEKGGRLWRNNSGAYMDDRGVLVRYGLCNESAKINKILKSSDLVGFMPFKIAPNHVGLTIARLTLREVKPSGWRFKGTERERAQLNFLEFCWMHGADAAFCASAGSL